MIVDLFAGGGGASVGIEAATRTIVDLAINHSATALAVHAANHPRTKHLSADIWAVDPKEAVGRRKVDLLWASPDCTHFSVAKGGKPREHGTRSLAWVVVDWARAVRPAVICLENVREFLGWGPLDNDGKPVKARMGETFAQWRGALEILGYQVDHRILDASLYGAPTRRRRLFLVARCDGQSIRWPDTTHGPGKLPLHTAAECIDWSLPCPSIFERERPLAEKTLHRIAQGIRRFVLENPRPYIVSIDQQSSAHAEQPLTEPLSTVVTKARHTLVAPTLIQTGYGERPGQRPRFLDLHEPVGTLMGGGQKHGLVAAFLAAHYGGEVGTALDQPIRTVTAQDHHSLVEARLVGDHRADVRAFLTTYFGSPADIGQDIREPLRTVTTRDRFGLVTVEGRDYEIADIGMRMLQPHELLRAQFGRFAEGYDLSAAETKSAKVRLIGNSVCPEAAEAVVAANLPTRLRRAA